MGDKKLKVILDFERTKFPHTGVGQMCLNLGEALLNTKSNLEFIFHVPKDQMFRWSDRAQCIPVNPFKRVFPIKEKGADLWHCVHQDPHDSPLTKGIPFLFTVLDLNYLKEKSSAKAAARSKKINKLIQKAAGITYISNYTKMDVERNFKIPQIPSKVIWLGVPHMEKSNLTWPEHLPQSPFLFTIGTIVPKKNFLVLIEFLKRLPKYNLVIAGAADTDYCHEIQKAVHALQLEARVFFVGKVSDNQRAWYYENMEALVFPSLLEGFGFPVVEAMSMGKPVFISNQTSLPEVGGPEAFVWENFDPNYMAKIFNEGMDMFFSNRDMPIKLKSWSENFSWKKVAQQYIEIYNQILESK